MAAANESQGLKIAVAAFVSLTVILAVTSYFLYSAYDKALAGEAKAQDDKKTAQKVQTDLSNEVAELRKYVGTRAEEADAYRAEIKNEQKKVDEKIAGIATKIDAAVVKFQDAGATGPELQEAKDTTKRLVQEYQGEVNKNYISSLARLADIFENIELEATAMAGNYTQLKRTLEAVNRINKEAIDVQTKAASDNKTDLMEEHDKHSKERADLHKKVDEYQTQINQQATEIATLTNNLRQLKEDTDKKLGLDRQLVRDLREQIGKDETVLGKAAGMVTFVDYSSNEMRTNLTRGMGAKPQMKLSVFDKSAPGVPTERPKGTIELIQVSDSYSIARIEKTNSPNEPMRPGDLLYSAAWSPGEPLRFALLGKIDLNRDGRDDRTDLKRLIVASGGIVEYDLPPPDAGKESGKLTGLITWYVTDDRKPMVGGGPKISDETSEYKEFQKKLSDAMRDARLSGVRPMRLERLLAYLGYDFAAPIRNRAEAYSSSAIKTLLRAKQASEVAKPAAGTEPEKGEEVKKEAPEKDKPEKEEK